MRRGQRRVSGAFPYARSIIATSSLVAGLMLFWGSLADPRTGDFADPKAAWLAFLAVAVLVPIVIYVDYRTQGRSRAEHRRYRRARAAGSSGFRATGADVARNQR